VIVVLCGVRRGPNGAREAVALAAHPGGVAHHAVVAPAAAEPRWVWRTRCTGPARLGRRLEHASRRDRMGRATAAIRTPVAGTARGWRGVLGGVRLRLDGATAYVVKSWGPGFAGHRWPHRRLRRPAEPLGSLEKAAPHPVATGPRATFRRRPATVAAFVCAAIGGAAQRANDAGGGFVGVVLLLAALAAGTASVVPRAALKGDGTQLPTPDARSLLMSATIRAGFGPFAGARRARGVLEPHWQSGIRVASGL
jgi:hypothetical protein